MLNIGCISNEVWKEKCKRRRVNGEQDEETSNLKTLPTFCTDLTPDCFVTPSPRSRLSKHDSWSTQNGSFDENHDLLVSNFLSKFDDVPFSEEEEEEEYQWREHPRLLRNATKLDNAFDRHLVISVGKELMSCLEQTRTVALTIMDSLETQLLLIQGQGCLNARDGDQSFKSVQEVTMSLVEADAVFSRGSACMSRSLASLALSRKS
jgi:hypothetical protein